MLQISTLFGTSFLLLKTVPRVRDLGKYYSEFCVLVNVDRLKLKLDGPSPHPNTLDCKSLFDNKNIY